VTQAATLTIRFLVELGLLAALAYWGFTVGDGLGAVALGLGAPLAAALVWGMFVAPKARRPVSVPVRLAIETVLFVGGAVALAAAGQRALGLAFAVVALATSAANAAFERSGHG
jgi:hypothetical protein